MRYKDLDNNIWFLATLLQLKRFTNINKIKSKYNMYNTYQYF